MDKQAMIKGGVALFALMMFTKTGSAASNSQLAATETKKVHDELVALREQLQESGVIAADDDPDAAASDDAEAEADEDAADATTTTRVTAAARRTGTTTTMVGATTTRASTPVAWSYSGAGGPANWATADAANAACAGTAQSPVDLGPAKVADLPDLAFTHGSATATAVTTTRGVRITFADGERVTVDGATNPLTELHVHVPSEHTIGGKRYAAELQFQYAGPSGRAIVVGVLVAEGAEAPAFAPLLAGLTAATKEPRALPQPLDVRALLPAVQAAYRYEGSLTTPPCTEGVLWAVMAQPLTMSGTQIAELGRLIGSPNSRPTQPLGDRQLLLDISVTIR